jgi:hypothetical protein
MNCAAGGEVGSIFDLLANNPLLASNSKNWNDAKRRRETSPTNIKGTDLPAEMCERGKFSDEGRNESIRKKEYETSSKPLLNFRFPVQEDLYLSSKLENSPISRQSINDAIIDMNRLNEKKMNCAAGGEVGSIFDLLANNPLLASRSIDGQVLNSDEQRQRQDKLREQLLNATKSSMPFDTFHKNNSRMDIAAD